MQPVFTAANLINEPIQDGDAGLILRKDGSFQIFSTGTIDPDALTKRQQEQGELLTLFALVINSPEIRSMLTDVVNSVSGNGPLIDLGPKH